MGKTIEELQKTMSQSEFLSWVEFYKLYPFDDYHRYYRPAALIASTMGAKVEQSLEWLQPDIFDTDLTSADLNTMKAFGLKPKG